MAGVVVVSGSRAGRSYPVDGTIVIGRDRAQCAVALSDDQKVSRHHARIGKNSEGAWTVRDLNSQNGTWLARSGGGKRRVETAVVLRDGDELEIGNTRLLFTTHQIDRKENRRRERDPVAPRPRSSRARSSAIIAGSIGVGIVVLALVGVVALSRPSTPTAAPATVAGAAVGPGTPTAPLDAKPAPGGNLAGCSRQAAVERIRPSVAWIFQLDARGQIASAGSGFVVHRDGYIMTNRHVVLDARESIAQRFMVIPGGRGAPLEAQVAGVDQVMDLAVLRTLSKENLPPIAWGQASAIRVGDEVVAVGFPLPDNPILQNGEPTATSGIISAQRVVEGTEYFQSSATTHPGNSGGPLVNLCGEVVGVNSAVVVDSQTGLAASGLHLAISSSVARLKADQWVPK